MLISTMEKNKARKKNEVLQYVSVGVAKEG